METRKGVLGQEQPDTLTSMYNLAYTFKSQGCIEKAVTLMAQVVNLRSDKLGENHPDTKGAVQALNQWENCI